MPVLVMILLGMACKRLKLLDQNGINNMKVLVTQIMLPVAIFHALATAEYNKETGILVGIMFVMLVISFSHRLFTPPAYAGSSATGNICLLWSVYMRAVLWPILCIPAFAERRIFPRSQCWILQGFCLGSVFTWECWDRWRTVDKIDVKKLFASAIRTPAFIASVLGIIAGFIRCGA